jgi:hypothetical protein
MLAQAPNSKRKRHQWRFRGIFRDAITLGVERSHLYRVLAGKRVSATLLKRYGELQKQKRQATASSQNNPKPEPPKSYVKF